MSLLPEVRNELLATAADRTSRPQRSVRGRLTRVLLPSAAVIVTLAVAAVILLTVGTHPNRPTRPQPSRPGQSTPPAKRAWVNAMVRAQNETYSRDHSCRPEPGPSTSRYRYGTPDPSITTELPALSQPPPAGQSVTAAELRSRAFARGIYIRYVRRGQMSGVTYYLIPAARLSASGPQPAHCYRSQRAAFQRLAKRFPGSQRAAALRYEDHAIQTQRAETSPVGVCLLYQIPGGSGQACRSIAALRLRPGDPIAEGGDNRQTVTALVVPSSVATVSARYADGSTKPTTITKSVLGNVVIFRSTSGWDPRNTPSLTFHSATGKLLWSTPPSP